MAKGHNSTGQPQQTLQLLLIVAVWFNASSTHSDENKGPIHRPFTEAKRNCKTSKLVHPFKCAQQSSMAHLFFQMMD